MTSLEPHNPEGPPQITIRIPSSELDRVTPDERLANESNSSSFTRESVNVTPDEDSHGLKTSTGSDPSEQLMGKERTRSAELEDTYVGAFLGRRLHSWFCGHSLGSAGLSGITSTINLLMDPKPALHHDRAGRYGLEQHLPFWSLPVSEQLAVLHTSSTYGHSSKEKNSHSRL